MEPLMEPKDVDNTEADAYEMSYSIALKILNEIMLNENESVETRIWAASIVLDHDPIYDEEFSNDKEK